MTVHKSFTKEIEEPRLDWKIGSLIGGFSKNLQINSRTLFSGLANDSPFPTFQLLNHNVTVFHFLYLTP